MTRHGKLWWLRRIDLEQMLNEVDPDQRSEAKTAASKHEPPVYNGLPFTEAEPRWVLLYEHIQRGQIHPSTLRRMKRVDLEYIAGHPGLHPGALQPIQSDSGTSVESALRVGRALKAAENVARATRELQVRAQLRGYLWSGAIGAVVGALVTNVRL